MLAGQGRGWEAFDASTRRPIAHKPLGSQTNRLRFNGTASYYLLGWVKLHKCVWCCVERNFCRIFLTNQPTGGALDDAKGWKIEMGFLFHFLSIWIRRRRIWLPGPGSGFSPPTNRDIQTYRFVRKKTSTKWPNPLKSIRKSERKKE